MKMNWKQAGIIGVVIYILSLPIMLWKSSHIGKLISILIMVMIFLWGCGKASDLYFSKIRYRMMVDEKMKPIDEQIKTLQDDVSRTAKEIGAVNDRIKSLMGSKMNNIESQLDGIEKSIDIIREEERQALKDKIIDLREQVRIYKKSIDSAEIRKQCELVAGKMNLLTEEEKERFFQDLKEIGFKISHVQDGSRIIYANAWNCASASTISFGVPYATMDTILVKSEDN